MEVKIYREANLKTKTQLVTKIEDLESCLERSKEELIVLTSISPQPELDCEGVEMPLHHTIPRTVSEIVNEIIETASSLYYFRYALDMLECCPEDIVFDD